MYHLFFLALFAIWAGGFLVGYGYAYRQIEKK